MEGRFKFCREISNEEMLDRFANSLWICWTDEEPSALKVRRSPTSSLLVFTSRGESWTDEEPLALKVRWFPSFRSLRVATEYLERNLEKSEPFVGIKNLANFPRW